MDRETFERRIVFKVDERDHRVYLSISVDGRLYTGEMTQESWTTSNKRAVVESMWGQYQADVN